MRIINRASQRRQFGHGAFQIAITIPGINLHPETDPGLLALGRFDHAILKPGAFLPMHPHRDDEIFSLVQRGTMLHQDTQGNIVPVSPSNLMLMNAGSGIQHEESIPPDQYTEEVEMLQIFLRPTAPSLPPQVQFANPDPPQSGVWRKLIAPCQTKMLVRSPAVVFDLHTGPGTYQLPAAEFECTTWLLYVFAGSLTLFSGETLAKGDSIILAEEPVLTFTVTAQDSIIVAFALGTDGQYTREGMFSGMN